MGEFNRTKYIFSSTTGMVDISSKAVKFREEQSAMLIKELFSYKVLLKDLISHSPNYRDRNLILNISRFILGEFEIFDIFSKKKQLPIYIVSKKTMVPKIFIETWQHYIITYTLILSNPVYKYIQDYIRIELNEESKAIDIYIEKNNDEHRGIVLKSLKRATIVLTSSGEFLKLKNIGHEVGTEIIGKERKGIKHYKLQIAIASVLILLSGFGIYSEYTKVERTLLLNTTSQIKYELNRFNKVIYTYSPYEKGKSLIEYVDPLDDSIDDVLKKSLEYAKDNGMIPKDGILITINGKPLKYGIFKETGEYIVENNISLLINNAGSQHKLYDSIIRQKEEKNEEKK